MEEAKIWLEKYRSWILLRFQHPNFIHVDNNYYWVTIGNLLKFMEEHMLYFTHGIYWEELWNGNQIIEISALAESDLAKEILVPNSQGAYQQYVTKYSTLNGYAHCFKFRYYYNILFHFRGTKTVTVFEVKGRMRQNVNPCCRLFAHSLLGAPVGLKQKSNACHLILDFNPSTGIQGGG